MPEQAAKLAERLATMGREQLIRTLRKMPCPFTVDFTEEFLDTVSTERLRHIALAAALHARRAPVA